MKINNKKKLYLFSACISSRQNKRIYGEEDNICGTLLTFSVWPKKIILKILKTSSFLFYIRKSPTSLERHDGE